MSSREQSAAFTRVILDDGICQRPSQTTGPGVRLGASIGVIALAGLGLLLAWSVAAYGYETIAAHEGIRDGRANQVTTMYGCWLAVVWVVGIVALGIAGRGESPSALGFMGFMNAIRGSRSLRRFTGAIAGVLGGTLVFGFTLMFLASLSVVSVTPPAAMLIMIPASALAAIWMAGRFDVSAKAARP